MVPLLRLRVSRNSSLLRQALVNVVLVANAPIFVEATPSLTAHRGRLLTGEARGTPIHAASFIRQRRIILESQLLSNPAAAQSILLHELFHFIWTRLGNAHRRSFTHLIAQEIVRHAAGEIGESCAVAKSRWKSHSSLTLWKNYVCEAFCDTGACIYSSKPPSHTLAGRWLARRRAWFLCNCPPDGWRC